MSHSRMIVSKNSLFSLIPLNLKILSPCYGPLWTSMPNGGHIVKTQPHSYCSFEWALTDAETGTPHDCYNNHLSNSLETLGLTLKWSRYPKACSPPKEGLNFNPHGILPKPPNQNLYSQAPLWEPLSVLTTENVWSVDSLTCSYINLSPQVTNS